MSLSWYEWKTIPWREIEKNVFKLQKRIYQASSSGNVKLVHRLQRLLCQSRSAKLLAVRRVTQDNRGKKTAGVDGKIALTDKERLELAFNLNLGSKPKPTRRVWIPKPGKAEKRPLGIPTIKDRATQALVKMAMEPEWESKFENNSYGFRPGRSCHDAIEAIFTGIRQQPKYVLDADISQCFDKINHQALLKKLNTNATLRRQIKAWLKAGVIDEHTFQKTPEGTPQGGCISPLLANIALHGLEEQIKVEMLPYLSKGSGESKKTKLQSLSIIRYADDFLVTHKELKVIKQCQELLESWLTNMGLELKESKTRICHTLDDFNGEIPGVDFLGFNIRQYRVGKHHTGKSSNGKPLGFKTIIKPSKKSIKNHYNTIRDLVQSMVGATQEAIIRKLNPIIKGWSRYYSTVVSRKVFERLSDLVHKLLWEWANKRHPHKGDQWIKRKYFRTHGGFNWRFMTRDGMFLIRHSDHKITRHTKVKGEKSPYDGDYAYWGTRMGKHPLLPPRKADLLKRQKGKCGECGGCFKDGDILEVHHKDGNHGNNKPNNLLLVHGHCHDKTHQAKV
jgi:RNA-directed DNA polymerase